MTTTERIIFSFDRHTKQQLVEITESGGFPSRAQAVRTSVGLFRQLQSLKEQGFTQLIMRNPENGAELHVDSTALGIPATDG